MGRERAEREPAFVLRHKNCPPDTGFLFLRRVCRKKTESAVSLDDGTGDFAQSASVRRCVIEQLRTVDRGDASSLTSTSTAASGSRLATLPVPESAAPERELRGARQIGRRCLIALGTLGVLICVEAFVLSSQAGLLKNEIQVTHLSGQQRLRMSR